ncbi:MAG TPA: hypothetical protein VFQ36_20350 [Ktedonobacteraceae bacterium]|nr:hypothetical protein [Ktedonobacteraceae bacterium]
MNDSILIGRQDKIISIPAGMWRQHLAQAQQHGSARLSFMTEEHHRVRNFVVSELPRNGGKPLRVEDIASRLLLPPVRVVEMLKELQQHLFFLVLNEAGEVSWAFPVTTDRTPHQLRFSSGESIFAA